MNRKQKRRSGNRIAGSLEPFMVDRLQRIYREIFAGGIVVENLFDLFREDSKIAIALRMRHAVAMNRPITNVSEESRDIIRQHLIAHEHEADSGYIICTIRYFLGELAHNVVLDMNCASCNSKDPAKALKHAQRDCEKYIKTYIGRILRKLKKNPWTNMDTDTVTNVIHQYESIEFSCKFVCAYLTKLCSGKLPGKLYADVYSRAEALDPSIALHYNHKDSNDHYTLNSKRNHSYSCVTQECATFIFCATYR